MDSASKHYWGPRLWRLYHLLADLSDRRDMVMLWNSLLRHTATVMPCEQCRSHLTDYLKTHSFVRFDRKTVVTGAIVRNKARNDLFQLHNAVNIRLEKRLFTESDMAAYALPRGESIAAINALYEEIKAAWTPLVHRSIIGALYLEWKRHLSMMIALAACGSDP